MMRLTLLKRAPQTDEQLMIRAAHGSQRAFEELYNRYAPRLQGFFLRQLSGDRELAADFTHDVFLRLFEARRTYREGRMVAPWLFTIAYNLCRNRYRRAQTEADFMASLQTDGAETSPVEVELDAQTLDNALQNVLQSLPAEARMLFSLHYEEELSAADCARIVGIPEGTVKSRLHKTITVIKQKLKKYEDH